MGGERKGAGQGKERTQDGDNHVLFILTGIMGILDKYFLDCTGKEKQKRSAISSQI